MRRPFVTTTLTLALALAPAVLFAQATPPAQTPPAQTPPAQPAPAQPAQPAAPQPNAGSFSAPAGMFLNTIKATETGAFETTMAKVREAAAKSTNQAVKDAVSGWKVYKASEPTPQGHVLYVFVLDPAVKDFDYSGTGVFKILQEGLGDATAREIFDKFRNAFAAGQNKLTLTPVTGQ